VITFAGHIDSARSIKRRLKERIATHLSNNWDLRHGVDTGGRVPLSLPGVEVSGVHARWAYDVVSTPPSVFSYMARFFPARRADYTYVDIGAGKGRTVMLASEMGFKRCVGVEFAKFASEIARKNLQSYIGASTPRSPCSIVETCATKFPFPDGDVVLFFNNPFSEQIWNDMVPRMSDIAIQNRAITLILIGSFPEMIGKAAEQLVRPGPFVRRAEGVTPRFWDSYARFHFFVLDWNQREAEV
jgi:Methyltransferase domain